MNTTEEYKGCRNCKYQPEPMKTCDWIKHQKEVYRVCPMWELKENKGGGMMERLTQTSDKGGVAFTFDLDVTCQPSEIRKILKIAEKLKEYEDLEEQGLLLQLPLEAYFIKDNKMYKGWVQELVYSPCRKLLLDIRYDDKTLDSYRGYVGNTVFLTQAEAEQKLREMESD